MAQYIPILDFHCGGIPLISTYHAASEGYFGINLEPLSKPTDISYTLLPDMAFYEFIPIKEKHTELGDQLHHSGDVYDQDCTETQNNKEETEPVELVDVKLGQCYEIVVTTSSGLYRYKIGDILMVTSFHNNAPHFRFVGRQGVLLSIASETTGEDGLLKAATQAKLFIEPLDFILTKYTSYADVSSTPGHYIIFWELKMKGSDHDISELNLKIIEECCYIVEESLDYVYRLQRNSNNIGPLETRVVKNGTFIALMDIFISKGSSISNYKTPSCIRSEEALKILDSRVVGRYFSQTAPSTSKLFEMEAK
ncbi:hypothetical protein DITRI_Ditri02bG0172600 [Diplodiscus trichospermus]